MKGCGSSNTSVMKHPQQQMPSDFLWNMTPGFESNPTRWSLPLPETNKQPLTSSLSWTPWNLGGWLNIKQPKKIPTLKMCVGRFCSGSSQAGCTLRDWGTAATELVWHWNTFVWWKCSQKIIAEDALSSAQHLFPFIPNAREALSFQPKLGEAGCN